MIAIRISLLTTNANKPVRKDELEKVESPTTNHQYRQKYFGNLQPLMEILCLKLKEYYF